MLSAVIGSVIIAYVKSVVLVANYGEFENNLAQLMETAYSTMDKAFESYILARPCGFKFPTV